jgi:UDP-N-acetylmuramoylalanine--D-glutamate ligase
VHEQVQTTELRGKQVLVVGLARTGLAVAAFLRNQGARVTVTDSRPAENLGAAVQAARAQGCRLALGDHPVEVFTAAELIVVSPGVPGDLPPLAAAADRGIPIIGELELASRFLRLPMVAITGTNGKTTTTSLVGAMLQRSGRQAFVGGNIGTPLIGVVQQDPLPEVVVAEVSSFQLDTASTFHPRVAVLLNITEDHLDRYESFSGYVRSKCRIFANQTETDTAVLPAEDPLITGHCSIQSRCLTFGRMAPSAHARLEGGTLLCHLPPDDPQRYDVSRWQVPGTHNQENLLAAVLAATCMGAVPAAIQETIDSFRGLRHRLEFIGSWRGVRFYNDSKATNVGAVARSLESFTSPVILIAGGRDKGGSYAPLAALVRQRVKLLVLMGEARFRLAEALAHLTYTVVLDTLEPALHAAVQAALPGDIVLLSPGCSSFDLYDDYQARGDHFRSLVQGLASGSAPPDGGEKRPWGGLVSRRGTSRHG